jgi:hypothetical protein
MTFPPPDDPASTDPRHHLIDPSATPVPSSKGHEDIAPYGRRQANFYLVFSGKSRK